MSLGTGYEYLLSSVVRGDGAVAPSSPLTRYYAKSGTPPGRWLGRGLAGLNDGAGIAQGSAVREEQLFHLLGMLSDPTTGRPLGTRPLRLPLPLAERVQRRAGMLSTALGIEARALAIARIEREEAEREKTIRRPVAGFDLTFSVPKSVSAVWALADAATQATIYRAHQEAIRIALDYAEQHIFFSRSGHAGAVQEPIRGVIAAAFDHWDSRAGDPHLHTHVVVANRVQTLDGIWRTLDSKTLHKYVVALSELHEGVLQDVLTARLGYAWDRRARRHSSAVRWDIAGVSNELISEFSRRSIDIDAATAPLVTQFVATSGRHPSSSEMLRLRQQATLQTRPHKANHTLSDQTAAWRERSRPFVGGRADAAATWADTLRDRNTLDDQDDRDLDDTTRQALANNVLQAVAGKRSTFTHANVLAETHRQLHGVRFATPHDRIAVAARIADTALAAAVMLTSRDRMAVGGHIWTTQGTLDAEERLLEASRSVAGPDVSDDIVVHVTTIRPSGTARHLGPDQSAAVHALATSGRELDVLVGPAGTGKTTCLAALRRAWEAEYGAGSVTGLAPSAVAAEVLAEELGVDTENLAKWVHETARQGERLDRMAALIRQINAPTVGPNTSARQQLHAELGHVFEDYERWVVKPGQLVIVDEAGLAGTLAIDRLVTETRDAGGKVILVGDWAQLGAIDAGGTFAMLVNDRCDTPELSTVRRFQNEWECDASLQLRAGDSAAIEAYVGHDRVRSGNRSAMLDQLYQAWRDDTRNGLISLMVATDYESVAELNLRARDDLVAAGEVDHQGVGIGGGGIAGVGDHVVTRQNDRRLSAGRSWVKNGDTWTVTALGSDGSVTVERNSDGAEVVLPDGYARTHVELGYAATTYRAQGRTVDTTHAFVGASTTRELLYVAATRGRTTNMLYVDSCTDPDIETSHDDGPCMTAEELLARVLERTGSDVSAHEVLEIQRELRESLAVEPGKHRTALNSLSGAVRQAPQASSPTQTVSLS